MDNRADENIKQHQANHVKCRRKHYEIYERETTLL